ncbi:MAG: hypothetical protein QME74_06920, partial [Candidatus Edwardsbacteria bacterium]|nr:hypothetical protein [Candidatus Edwardsbacteria bacterium]
MERAPRAYKKHIESIIDECRAESNGFAREIDGIVEQIEKEEKITNLDRRVDEAMLESKRLGEMISGIAQDMESTPVISESRKEQEG